MSAAEVLQAGAQTGSASERHTPHWIARVDALLDLHRSDFLSREPTATELKLHKASVGLAIQTGLLINSVIENPAVRLRLELLADAYTLFHDPNFSEAAAERLLQDLFPE